MRFSLMPVHSDSGAFVGANRIGIANRIVRTILAGTETESWGIYGNTQMGKTSLLLEVRRQLLLGNNSSFRVIPIYINLAAKPTNTRNEVLALFQRELITETEKLFNNEEWWSELSQGLAEIKNNLIPSQENEFLDRFKEDYKSIRLNIQSYLERVKVIFLIDGFAVLDNVAWKNDLCAYLRAFLTDAYDFEFASSTGIIIGSSSDKITDVKSQQGSPLENVLNIALLESLSKSDVHKLASLYPFGAIADMVVEYIFQLTGGHPFLSQYILYKSEERKDDPVTIDTVTLIARNYLDTRRNDFETWCRRLTDVDKEVYEQIAQHNNVITLEEIKKKMPGTRKVPDSLVRLTYTGLVTEIEPQSDRYVAPCLLFRGWFLEDDIFPVASSLIPLSYGNANISNNDGGKNSDSQIQLSKPNIIILSTILLSVPIILFFAIAHVANTISIGAAVLIIPFVIVIYMILVIVLMAFYGIRGIDSIMSFFRDLVAAIFPKK